MCDLIISQYDFDNLKTSLYLLEQDNFGNEIFSSIKEQFKHKLEQNNNLHFYTARYKYNADFDKNMCDLYNKKFVELYSDFSNVLFVCFMTLFDPLNNSYICISHWIINSNELLQKILLDENFIFKRVENIELFVDKFVNTELSINSERIYLL